MQQTAQELHSFIRIMPLETFDCMIKIELETSLCLKKIAVMKMPRFFQKFSLRVRQPVTIKLDYRRIRQIMKLNIFIYENIRRDLFVNILVDSKVTIGITTIVIDQIVDLGNWQINRFQEF